MLLHKKSQFFEAALRGSFAEAHSSRIEIKDHDPAIVARMLYWFYTNEIVHCLDDDTPFSFLGDVYTENLNGYESDYSLWSCKLGVAMYAIATQFGIPGLQGPACEVFEEEFGGPDSTSPMWHDDPFEVEDLIRSVYETTSEAEHGLRDLVVWRILLERQKDLKFYCATNKLLRSIPDLAMDVATCFLTTETADPKPEYHQHMPEEGLRLVRPCSDRESQLCNTKHQWEKPPTPTSDSDEEDR